MLLVWLLADFQSLPPLSTSKLSPSGADSWVGGLVYVLGSYGSFQQTLLRGWVFLLPPNPHRVLQPEVWGFISCIGTLGCMVCLTPQLFPSSLSACEHGTAWSTSHCLTTHPLCPSCPSLPFLPVWMSVFSLTPWLLDFHTVWFSGSSGCCLLLNWLLSSFCARKQCVSTYASLSARISNLLNFLLYFHEGKISFSYLITSVAVRTYTYNVHLFRDWIIGYHKMEYHWDMAFSEILTEIGLSHMYFTYDYNSYWKFTV